jgi:predicted RNase H-like HicB family nuclease
VLAKKAKGKTLEDAREDMEILRGYIHDLAEDVRQVQPEDPHKG